MCELREQHLWELSDFCWQPRLYWGHGVGYNYLLPISGNASVYCFFMISGFYMAMILNEKYIYHRAVRTFYLNRVLRLFPAYLTVCLLVLVYRALFAPHEIAFYFDKAINPQARIQAFSSNFFMIGMDHLRYLAKGMGLPDRWRLVPQAWSLDTEMLFYFMAPLFLSGKNGKRLRVLVFVVVAIALFATRDELLQAGLWMFIPGYLVFFAAGATSYYLGRFSLPRIAGCTKWVFAALAAAILALCFFLHLDHEGNPLSSSYYPIYALFYFAVPAGFAVTKTIRFDAFLGELSYPIYIVHVLLIEMMQGFRLDRFGWISSAACFAAIIAASVLLKRFVDDPVETIRRRLGAGPRRSQLVQTSLHETRQAAKSAQVSRAAIVSKPKRISGRRSKRAHI